MFTDNLSDTWDTSEFQESFIKNYFVKKKVSKLETEDPPKSSLKNSKDVRQVKKESREISLNSTLSKSKDVMNSSRKDMKIKRKFCNSSEQGNLVGDGNDSDLDEIDLDFPTVDSYSPKPKKKRRKSKNKVVSEPITSNSSETESVKQRNEENKFTEMKKVDKISNSSSTEKSMFQNKLCQRLQAAKFRYLNEMLYTSTGKDALSYFQESTEEFQDYHEGYQSQVSKWPLNPVDIIIEEIRHMDNQSVIADLGCGEAKIAQSFPKRTVHSFDLIALKDCVTACDVSNVPLPNRSVDVVVFCLSLMGTNWRDYLIEGHRILKFGAALKIAEIESRIDNLNNFIKNIEAHGFSLVNKDVSHKMFIFLNFKKAKSKVKSSKIPPVTLKPCLYKKR